MAAKRFGRLPPRYRFALNSFAGVRWSKCPRCSKPTHARKFPLLIHIDDFGAAVLGKTCRYCSACEFIIAHQAELEDELAHMLSKRKPEAIGNEYLVFGVVDRKVWQRGLHEQLGWEQLREHTSDIKQHMTLHDPRLRWISDPDESTDDG
jgi:hypothetical protein